MYFNTSRKALRHAPPPIQQMGTPVRCSFLDGPGFESRQEARNLCVLQYIQKGSEARPTSYSTDGNTGTVFLLDVMRLGVQVTTHLHAVSFSPGQGHFALIEGFHKIAKSDY